MRTSTMVALFALALPAQDPVAEGGKELVEIVAVEEQEHDLAKAEAGYRKLLRSGTLSPNGRAAAAMRLGQLLRRLGKVEEGDKWFEEAGKGGPAFAAAVQKAQAPGQDVERLSALRVRAKELVADILNQRAANYGGPLYGIGNVQLAEQLLWIGAPAVPEVIAALQAIGKEAFDDSYEGWGAAYGLAGFLWRTGGDAAAAFLLSCVTHQDVKFRRAMSITAFHAEHEQMLQVAAKFLRDPDPTDRVQSDMLTTTINNGPMRRLQDRLDPDLIVEAAIAGSVPGKLRLLDWARADRQLSATARDRILHLVRTSLRSTDPVLGRKAQQFLMAPMVVNSVEGVELLLTELPAAQFDNVGAIGRKDAFTDPDIRRLLPRIVECARALGEHRAGNQRQQWLQSFCRQHGQNVFDAASTLQLVDLGYPVWGLLEGQITKDNCKEVFARFDRIDDQPRFLAMFQKVELPADFFALLRDKAEEVRRLGTWQARGWPLIFFASTMAVTGNPETADWAMAEWQRTGGEPPVPALDLLASRSQDERVRVALRAVVAKLTPGKDRSRLLTRLLEMNDVPALDSVLAADQSHGLSAELKFLVQGAGKPGHGYTDDQVIGVARSRFKDGVVWEPNHFMVDAIPDRVLCELGRLAVQSGRGEQWLKVIMRRISDRKPETQGRAELVSFVEKLLASDELALRRRAIQYIDRDDVALLQPAIEVRVDDDNPEVAHSAFVKLCSVGIASGDKWLQRALKSKHANIRSYAIERLATDLGEAAERTVLPFAKDESIAVRLAVANYFGTVVSKAAVPDLIQMLRDENENIRTAAAESLTRIRFFHEQQAHWDRVLKGLDASPASANEKLLLQAKPGAPRDQRLLAVKSLGALGQPEALPFLIEWSQDDDADIAAAARAATLQILQRSGVPAVK